MKPYSILFIIVLVMSQSLTHAQQTDANAEKSESVSDKGRRTKTNTVLVFDFSTKMWHYEDGRSAYRKGVPYFLIPYKSQPVIKVTKCPSTYTVKINSTLVDVDLVTEEKGETKAAPTNASLAEFTQTSKMVDSDEAEFEIIISENDKTIHTSTAYAKVFGGLKVDVSTGVLFHNVTDDSYTLADVGSGQLTLTRSQKKETWRPLFPVVFTHFYTRPRRGMALGLGAGVGISDEGKAGFYAGPSLLLGDRRRGVITLGWAHRPAARLKGRYLEGETFASASAPKEEDLVSSVYQSGFFFALSYNLKAETKKR